MFMGFNRKNILLNYYVSVYNDQQIDQNEEIISTNNASKDCDFLYWLNEWRDDPMRDKLFLMLCPE
jgi:hypothetical protein